MSASYSPQDEYLKTMSLCGGQEPVKAPTRPSFGTSFQFFEDLPANVSGPIRNWLGHEPADRLRIAQVLAAEPKVIQGETKADYQLRLQQQQRDLCFILVEEARAGRSRDVAAVAFMALFPEKKK